MPEDMFSHGAAHIIYDVCPEKTRSDRKSAQSGQSSLEALDTCLSTECPEKTVQIEKGQLDQSSLSICN